MDLLPTGGKPAGRNTLPLYRESQERNDIKQSTLAADSSRWSVVKPSAGVGLKEFAAIPRSGWLLQDGQSTMNPCAQILQGCWA
jgi:hypothetical protein